MQTPRRERLEAGQGSSLHGSRPRRSQRSSLGWESRTGATLFVSSWKMRISRFPVGSGTDIASLCVAHRGDGWDRAVGGGDGFGGKGSGGGVGEGGTGLGGDGFSGMVFC